MPQQLEGKTAIVTGAGRGIGREIALLFAKLGARVVVNDLGVSITGEGQDVAPAQQVVEEIRGLGGVALSSYGDVAEMDQAEALVKQALDAWGQLDILVNVAGILRDRMVFNMTEEEWDAVIRVHMKGTFATTRFASMAWRQQRTGGRLLNFTSGAGLFGSPGQANYAAAKMGIWGFTLSCARALERYGVTANSIGPVAATRMMETIPTAPDHPGAARPGGDDALRSERDAANVAPMVAYLASDQGGWITGRCFGVSGYRVTLYRNIEPEVVLQGSGPWELNRLGEQVSHTFRSAIERRAT